MTEVLITLIFNLLETATEFKSKPSSPSYTVQGADLTLKWRFMLNSSMMTASISILEDGRDLRIGKTLGPGLLKFESNFQQQFRANIMETKFELKIFQSIDPKREHTGS